MAQQRLPDSPAATTPEPVDLSGLPYIWYYGVPPPIPKMVESSSVTPTTRKPVNLADYVQSSGPVPMPPSLLPRPRDTPNPFADTVLPVVQVLLILTLVVVVPVLIIAKRRQIYRAAIRPAIVATVRGSNAVASVVSAEARDIGNDARKSEPAADRESIEQDKR